MDLNGRPMSGALLYLYEANTSTPVTAYQDTDLTAGQELPWPIEADANGRLPAFWLADGSYRARLTNSVGVVQFDEQNVLALGASDDSGGGGGGTTVDPNAIAATGDVKWRPMVGTLSGWVRINGRTIGSATSGASERANADTQALWEHIYNNFSDTLCPVSGGRTGNATNDFTADKTITLLDMRDRGAFGLDDMGGAAASGFTGVTFNAGGSSTVGGTSGGGSTVTIAQSNLPNISLTVTIPAGQGSHLHNLLGADQSAGGGHTSYASASNAGALADMQAATLPAMTGSTASINSSVAQTVVNKMPWFMLGTWFWRL